MGGKNSEMQCNKSASLDKQTLPAPFAYFQGMSNMSDLAISFHYVTPDEMYTIEFFIYHFQRFGVLNGSSLWGTSETPAKELLRLLMWYSVGDHFREYRE